MEHFFMNLEHWFKHL